MHTFCRVPALLLAATTVCAQIDLPFKARPNGHEDNRARVARIHQDELHRFAGDTNHLVLPGLIADRNSRRVEVRVERSAVGPEAPCEFLVVNEASEHGYESLLIAFARPSDIHAALRFIGTEAGQSYHPPSHRFWAKGERFSLTVRGTHAAPIRVEDLLVDRRTGAALPPDGFLFTGSRRIPAPDDPARSSYAADAIQPMAIVSLFSKPYAVFEVPRTVSKETVYRNTTVNPEYPIAEGTLLTLTIEPAFPPTTTTYQDLTLHVDAVPRPTHRPRSKVEALAELRVQLRHGTSVLNPDGSLVTAIQAIAALDSQNRIPYLTLHWSSGVRLASAQALAEILSSLDREQGIRIEPPLPGDPYYRAFTPDRQLLDRSERLFHPWELTLQQKDGRISGHLLLVDSIWKEGASHREFEITEHPIQHPADLGQKLASDRERNQRPGRHHRPEVLLAFTPSDFTMGQLAAFLEPVLTNHTAVHLFLDESAPPTPPKPAAP